MANGGQSLKPVTGCWTKPFDACHPAQHRSARNEGRLQRIRSRQPVDRASTRHMSARSLQEVDSHLKGLELCFFYKPNNIKKTSALAQLEFLSRRSGRASVQAARGGAW